MVDKEGAVLKEYQPKVYNEVTEVSEETYNLVHQGMINMVARDTRFQSVRAAGLQMAGKTGTAQQSNTHADHVLFVGFAPSTEPQIALSVRIANGYSSGYPSEIARDMVRKYFGLAEDSQLIFGKAGVLGAETHAD